jgi:hypothetical protein
MKPGLTVTRHQEIGKRLTEIRSELVSLSVEVSNAYPLSGKKARYRKALQKAVQGLSDARNYGEENLIVDHPNKWVTYDYYPLDNPDETERLRQAQKKRLYGNNPS